MNNNIKKFVINTGVIKRSEFIFYNIGLWPKDNSSILYKIYGISIFITFYVSYLVATALGMLFSSKFVEKIHLSLVTFSVFAILYRVLIFFRKKEQIQHLISMINDYSIDDWKQFTRINRKIKTFEKYAYLLMYIPSTGIFMFIFVPIISNSNVLIINIWVPIDWEHSSLAFWITCTYSLLCLSFLVIAFQPSLVIWYTMLNISIQYEILGDQLMKLGHGTGPFKTDFINLVKEHRKINCQVTLLVDTFNSLFTMQVATSVISLCAGVFVVAFIKPNTMIDYFFYGITLFYVVMDIFFLMYYGNEIKLYWNNLSTQLFQSNWIEQSIQSKKLVIILMEFLKHPKQVTFGLVIFYPLTLETFTMILKSSYSLFSVLSSM